MREYCGIGYIFDWRCCMRYFYSWWSCCFPSYRCIVLVCPCSLVKLQTQVEGRVDEKKQVPNQRC